MSSTNTMRQPYVQLPLALVWAKPTDRVAVRCGCGWTGRRLRRAATRRACPQCVGSVTRS